MRYFNSKIINLKFIKNNLLFFISYIFKFINKFTFFKYKKLISYW